MNLRLLLGALALAATTAVPALADDAIKIGFITKFPVSFYTAMSDSAKAYAAAHPGIDIVYGQGTSATDIDGQIALIDSMISQGVKGIAITPVDPSVSKELDKAIAAGIPVVALNVSAWVEGYQWTAPALFGLVLVMAGNVIVFRKPKAAPAAAVLTAPAR